MAFPKSAIDCIIAPSPFVPEPPFLAFNWSGAILLLGDLIGRKLSARGNGGNQDDAWQVAAVEPGTCTRAIRKTASGWWVGAPGSAPNMTYRETPEFQFGHY